MIDFYHFYWSDRPPTPRPTLFETYYWEKSSFLNALVLIFAQTYANTFPPVLIGLNPSLFQNAAIYPTLRQLKTDQQQKHR